jgi:hypothetical protein
MRGASSGLTVTYPPLHRGPQVPWPQALGLAGVIALAVLLRRSALLNESLVRVPYVAGAVAGCLWWLLFTPGIIGLAIVLLCSTAALRTPYVSAR